MVKRVRQLMEKNMAKGCKRPQSTMRKFNLFVLAVVVKTCGTLGAQDWLDCHGNVGHPVLLKRHADVAIDFFGGGEHA